MSSDSCGCSANDVASVQTWDPNARSHVSHVPGPQPFLPRAGQDTWAKAFTKVWRSWCSMQFSKTTSQCNDHIQSLHRSISTFHPPATDLCPCPQPPTLWMSLVDDLSDIYNLQYLKRSAGCVLKPKSQKTMKPKGEKKSIVHNLYDDLRSTITHRIGFWAVSLTISCQAGFAYSDTTFFVVVVVVSSPGMKVAKSHEYHKWSKMHIE